MNLFFIFLGVILFYNHFVFEELIHKSNTFTQLIIGLSQKISQNIYLYHLITIIGVLCIIFNSTYYIAPSLVKKLHILFPIYKKSMIIIFILLQKFNLLIHIIFNYFTGIYAILQDFYLITGVQRCEL